MPRTKEHKKTLRWYEDQEVLSFWGTDHNLLSLLYLKYIINYAFLVKKKWTRVLSRPTRFHPPLMGGYAVIYRFDTFVPCMLIFLVKFKYFC